MSKTVQEQQPWRYTWEALSHVKILRLFLIHSSICPQVQCLNLSASLLRPNPNEIFKSVNIVIKWNEISVSDNCNNNEVSVRIPVPPVVLDHSFPIQLKSLSDHIEAKLVLLLPVDDPCSQCLSALMGVPQHQTDSHCKLQADIQILELKGQVHLYCRNCSVRLTEEPLRSFKDQPSVNWREIADNWFGGCCCSFGGVSHSLVSNFEKTSISSKGTCFVGITSLAVHVNDIKTDVLVQRGESCDVDCHEGDAHFVPFRAQSFSSPLSNTANELDMSPNRIALDRKRLGCSDNSNFHHLMTDFGDDFESNERNGKNFPRISKFGSDIVHDFKHGCEDKSIGLTRSDNNGICAFACNASGSLLGQQGLLESSESTAFLSSDNISLYSNIKNSPIKSMHLQGGAHESVSFFGRDTNMSRSCCAGNMALEHEERAAEFSDGFMMAPSNVSEAVEWKEVCCSSCHELLGCYPCLRKGKAQPTDSVRLFKCQISTNEQGRGPDNVFRDQTIQNACAKYLQSSADNEYAYRTVIRNVKSKVPTLQLVFLNSSSWLFSGECFEKMQRHKERLPKIENIGPNGDEGLETCYCKLIPAARILFSDCGSAASEKLRAIDDWATQKHAENIYRLEGAARKIRETLCANKSKFPASFNLLEGFSISFFEM